MSRRGQYKFHDVGFSMLILSDLEGIRDVVSGKMADSVSGLTLNDVFFYANNVGKYSFSDLFFEDIIGDAKEIIYAWTYKSVGIMGSWRSGYTFGVSGSQNLSFFARAKNEVWFPGFHPNGYSFNHRDSDVGYSNADKHTYIAHIIYNDDGTTTITGYIDGEDPSISYPGWKSRYAKSVNQLLRADGLAPTFGYGGSQGTISGNYYNCAILAADGITEAKIREIHNILFNL